MASLDERAQQVSMIGEMYGGCVEVLMWLGETEGTRSRGDRQTLEQGRRQLRKFIEDKDYVHDPTYRHRGNHDVLAAFAIFSIFASDRYVS